MCPVYVLCVGFNLDVVIKLLSGIATIFISIVDIFSTIKIISLKILLPFIILIILHLFKSSDFRLSYCVLDYYQYYALLNYYN